MSANRTEQTLPTSPGSPAAPRGMTVGLAALPAAPHARAARPAAASRPPAEPVPDSATLVANLRRALPAGQSAAAVERVPAAVAGASPRDIAAAVRGILSPRSLRDGEGDVRDAAGWGASEGKYPGKSGKSLATPLSRKRARPASPPSPPRHAVRRLLGYQSPGDRAFARRLCGLRGDAVAGEETPAVFPCPAISPCSGEPCNLPLGPGWHNGAGVPIWDPGFGFCSDECAANDEGVTCGAPTHGWLVDGELLPARSTPARPVRASLPEPSTDSLATDLASVADEVAASVDLAGDTALEEDERVGAVQFQMRLQCPTDGHCGGSALYDCSYCWDRHADEAERPPPTPHHGESSSCAA